MFLAGMLARATMTWLTEWSPTFGRSRPARERRPGTAAVRKVCRGCERQRALFRCHGIVKWDRYHTLCFRCFRAQVNRARAAGAGQAHSSTTPTSRPAEAPTGESGSRRRAQAGTGSPSL